MTSARILVVDDEADINTILSVTLRRAGYDVISAADGLEALEVIHHHAPDLILLDVMMPRADGLEALRRIPALLPLLERERALSAQALADRLIADVLARGGSRIQDDMTVFVLERS